MADDLKILQSKFQALDKKLSDFITAAKNRFERNIKGVMMRNDIKLLDKIKKNTAEDNKKAEQTAKNVATLVKKFNEIDKKFAEHRKSIDALDSYFKKQIAVLRREINSKK